MMKEEILRAIGAVRATSPLVHSITNYVVMNVTANALLAAHASPLMAHAPEELDDLTDIDSALVLNIGTLDAHWLESMEYAGKLMRAKGKPVVLDPVGAGASRLRTEASLRLLDMVRPQIVRGNASEVMALASEIRKAERLPSPASSPSTKGVDSLNDSRDAVDSARFLASRFSCVVSISGKHDFITDGQTVLMVEGGSPLMPLVTGMGCSASAVTGAYAACAAPLVAAAASMAVFASAGEKAAAKAAGPGTFLPHFLDELYAVDAEDAAKRVKVVEA